MSGYEVARVGEKLPWTFDWTSWLTGADTISTYAWTVSPSLSLTNEATATVTAEGFVRGVVYRLALNVTTAAGVKGERTVVLRAL